MYSPTVLRLRAEAGVGGCRQQRGDAEELAARLGVPAAGYRTGHWDAPPPTPCRCHECL